MEIIGDYLDHQIYKIVICNIFKIENYKDLFYKEKIKNGDEY